MTDTFSPGKRSSVMRAIKGKDTKPEMIVRSAAHRLGYRFRLHQRDLPGCPDLVFKRYGKVIFVHGCFWHGHSCKAGRLPKSNLQYWTEKIQRNKERDAEAIRTLQASGWSVGIFWECQVKNGEQLANAIRQFLTGA